LIDERLWFMQHMARLYAFADVYDTPQLRQDTMTVLVELVVWNPGKLVQRDCFVAIRELHDTLPLNAPICQYIIKKLATYSSFGGKTKTQLEKLPAAFLVELLMVTGPVKLRKVLLAEVCDQCKFHGHKDDDEVNDCRGRQRRDGTFYASFLRACLGEVSAVEEIKKAGTARRSHKQPNLAESQEDLEDQSLLEVAEDEE
jgi:hypothetical protein